MRLERRLGYETEERRLHAHACRLRPQRTSLVFFFNSVTMVTINKDSDNFCGLFFGLSEGAVIMLSVGLSEGPVIILSVISHKDFV